MQLTTYTDYCLRVLMYVGLKGDQRSTIAEIAEAYDISRNHLMKVVNDLQHRGLLDATRGRNGGLRLALPHTEINVGRVVREAEGSFALVECFGPSPGGCAITGACRLQSALSEALAAFLAVLDRYTLADLLANPHDLCRRLGVPGEVRIDAGGLPQRPRSPAD